MAGRQYCELSTINHKEAFTVGQQRLCLLTNQDLKSCIDFAWVARAEVEQIYAKGKARAESCASLVSFSAKARLAGFTRKAIFVMPGMS